jgi:hypothetical protein
MGISMSPRVTANMTHTLWIHDMTSSGCLSIVSHDVMCPHDVMGMHTVTCNVQILLCSVHYMYTTSESSRDMVYHVMCMHMQIHAYPVT